MDPLFVIIPASVVAIVAMVLEMHMQSKCMATMESTVSMQERYLNRLLKQIQDLENRLTAKDIQGYQVLQSMSAERVESRGRSDEEEAELFKIRQSIQ